jgi:hypothetical protein
MKAVLVLFSVWTLAGCAPPGSHYDGFTLRTDAQQLAYDQARQARAQAKMDARWDAYERTIPPQPRTQPGTLTEDQYWETQNRIYNDQVYWAATTPPPPYSPSVPPEYFAQP